MKAATTNDLSSLIQPKDNKKANQEFMQQYLLPLVFFISALLMVFLLVLPQLDYSNTLIGNIGELQKKYNELTTSQDSLKTLLEHTNSQLDTLSIINKIIPQSQTAVVDFSEKIRQKASQYNLVLSNTVSGEVVTVAANAADKSQPGLELVELPADFSLQGNFNDIRDFLGSLYAGDDFIIIKKMDLHKKAGESNDSQFVRGFAEDWTLNVILAKYQLRASGNATAEQLQKSYFNVPESAKAQAAVVDFITKNYGSAAVTATPAPELTAAP